MTQLEKLAEKTSELPTPKRPRTFRLSNRRVDSTDLATNNAEMSPARSLAKTSTNAAVGKKRIGLSVDAGRDGFQQEFSIETALAGRERRLLGRAKFERSRRLSEARGWDFDIQRAKPSDNRNRRPLAFDAGRAYLLAVGRVVKERDERGTVN